MMNTAAGDRKGENALAPSTAGRKAARKRRPGEALEGMVCWEPVWVFAWAIVSGG